MKKLLMMTLMMCLVGLSYGQDTIVLNNNEKIIAHNLKPGNIPTENPNIWIKGYYYNDDNGTRKAFPLSEIKELLSNKNITQSNIVVKDSPHLYKNDIKLGGYYIENGSKLKNYSLFLQIIGAGIATLGATQEDGNSIVMVGGVLALASIPINVIGNCKISKGGRLIKNYKF